MSNRNIIIKNISATNTYRILSVPIPPNSQLSFTSYSFAGLADSLELRNGVANGDLIISDGVTDYDALNGLAYVVNQVAANPIFVGKEGLRIPFGTTEQRPVMALSGTIRFNTTTSQLEYFSGSEWKNLISITTSTGQLLLDRISDKDNNTYIDVDPDDTGELNQIHFGIGGNLAMIMQSGSFTLYNQNGNEPQIALVSVGDGTLRLLSPTLAHDVKFTFPANEGKPNQVLTTNGNGVTYWASVNTNASITKNYLDTLMMPSGIVRNSDSWTPSMFSEINKKHANYVINQYSLYGERCRFEVEILPSGVKQTGLNFPTIESIYAWINANLAVGSIPDEQFIEAALIKPYDELDSSIPVLDKVRGFNRAFSAIKGGKKYLKRIGTAINAREWDYPETFMQMFRYAFPNTSWIQEFSNASLFSQEEYKRTVWVCKNYKTLYGLPKPNDTMFVNTEERLAFDPITKTPTSSIQSLFTLGNPVLMIWEGPNKFDPKSFYYFRHQAELEIRNNIESQNPGSTQGWVNITDNSKVPARRLLLKPHRSAVLIYPVTNANGHVAIYVKPLGIDTIYTNWVDTSNYWIEAVFFGQDTTSYKFKDIPPNEIYRARREYDEMAFNAHNFIFDGVRPKLGSYHGGWNKPYKCYFRLRDKLSLRVGGLSKGYVSASFGGVCNPLMFMVNADK